MKVDRVHGYRAGLAVLEARPEDVLRVACTRAIVGEVERLLGRRDVHVGILDDRQLEKLAHTSQHEGLVLEAKAQRWLGPSELGDRLGPTGVAIALDRVRNSYNVGAILRSAAFFGVDAKRLSRPWISVTSSWRDRAASRFRRSSRWAAFIDSLGFTGFVASSLFLRLRLCGADLKLTCGFLPTFAASLPPGHSFSACCACGEMHTSAAVAGPATTAPPASARAPAATRRARFTRYVPPEFGSLFIISVPSPEPACGRRCARHLRTTRSSPTPIRRSGMPVAALPRALAAGDGAVAPSPVASGASSAHHLPHFELTTCR